MSNCKIKYGAIININARITVIDRDGKVIADSGDNIQDGKSCRPP